MELDQYPSGQLEDQQKLFQQYQAPPNAKFYRHSMQGRPNLIPIRNIILSEWTSIVLNDLRIAYGSRSFSTQRQVPNPDDLSRDVFSLLTKFEGKQVLPPIHVRQRNLIGTPSQSDRRSISILGEGSPMALNIPILTDYIYEMLDGDNLVALSIFFGYDHIPVIIVP